MMTAGKSSTKKSAQRARRVLSAQEALDAFLEKRNGKTRLHLNALWENWDIVLGPDLSELGKPLACKDNILVIGAEDNMAMQDLSMSSQDILDLANAFMDSQYFRRVRVVLLQGKRPLTVKRTPREPVLPRRLPAPPANLGNMVGKFPDTFPLKDCYEAYVRMFNES